MEEHDVFISYAHRDNQPILHGDSARGWVSNFDEILRNLLTRELGRDARIWRDPSIDTGEYFWDKIKGNLLKSKAFILILSPSYINSEWCRNEFDTFIRERKPIRVGDKSCIFPIVKKPIENGEIPLDLQNFLKDVLFVEFFKREENEKTLTFDVEYGDDLKRELLKRIDFLAQDIFLLLKEAESVEKTDEPSEPTALKPFAGMTVYLAEPTPDLWDEYLKIRRDFIKRGANVLPSSFDFSRPERVEDYKSAMLSDLKQSKLAVHFIGSEDDAYSDDNRQSLVHLQMSIAAEFQTGADCKRLIWLPQDVAPVTEQHAQFIAQLPAMTSRNVDLMRTTLDLKTEMERILLDKPKPQTQPAVETVKKTVYILHDNRDAGAVARIVDKLFENGCEVWTVSQTGGADLIEEHKWYLLNCDAAIVYWNNAMTFQVRAMMSEFQRVLDNGRERAFEAKGVLIEGASPEKDNFRTHETVIRNDEDFAAFLFQLKNGGGQTG